MRDDRDFDSIIDAMGGIPQPMMPPEKEPDKWPTILKIIISSVILLIVQSAMIAFFAMVGYGVIAEEFGLAKTGVGYLPMWESTLYAVLLISTLRKATS